MEYGGGGRGAGDCTPANVGEHLDNAADRVQNVAEAAVRVAGSVAEAANATSSAIAAFESVPFGAILSVARVILAMAVNMHANRRRAQEMHDAVEALVPFVNEFRHECETHWSGIVRDPNKVLRIRTVVDYLSKQLINAQACLQKNCNRNAVVRFFLASSIREEFRESMEKIERGALFLSLGLSAVTARNVETLLKGAPLEPLVVAAVDVPSDAVVGAAHVRPSSARFVSMRRLASMGEAAREDEQGLLREQVESLASPDALLDRVSALAEQAASGLYEGIRVFRGVLAAAVAMKPEPMRAAMAKLEPPAVRAVLEALIDLQKQKQQQQQQQQQPSSAVAAVGSLSEGELRVIAQLTDLDAVLRARRIVQANALVRGGGRGRGGSAVGAVDAPDIELGLPLDDGLVIDEDVEWAAFAGRPATRSPFTLHTATWKGMAVLAKRFASTRWTREIEQVLHREVSNLRALLNPHIVKLYGIARPGGERKSPALIYEPMDTTLECVLALPDMYPLRRADRLRIVEGIARGLLYVHSQGLLHHDIEPRHVYVNVARDHRIEAVKLAGFGLARVAGAVTGGESILHMQTSLYMAPEVHRREAYRAPADVFAFALLAHYVLSGCAPYDGRSSVVGAELRAGTRPVPLTAAQAPSGMNELLAHCWAESPASRPTVAALWDELVVILGAEIDGLASPDSASEASSAADVLSAAVGGSDPQPRAQPPPLPPPVPMSPTRRLVEVVHAYHSDELGHVSLEQGDVVEVISEVNSDWCCVTVGKTVGIVPRAFLSL